eukprot:15348691-Ditylum_brightwellii.AAC.1
MLALQARALLPSMDPGPHEEGQGCSATSHTYSNNKQSTLLWLLWTSSGASHTTDIKPGALDVDNLIPGQCVSTDQYASKVKGQLPHIRGEEKSVHMYTRGTIFIDNMSSVMFVSNQ